MVKYYTRNGANSDEIDTSPQSEATEKAKGPTFPINSFEPSSSDLDVKPNPCQLVPNWHQTQSLKRSEHVTDLSDNIQTQNKRQKFDACENSQNQITENTTQSLEHVTCGLIPTSSSGQSVTNEMNIGSCKPECDTW